MFKKVFLIIVSLLCFLILGGVVMIITGVATLFNPPEQKIAKNAILAMELNGIILDSREFIDTLSKYRKDDHIKGVLITVNSPGGVVGPSQEMYNEIRRTITEFKKPVYMYCSGLTASGAYYAAAGASQIYTTPGCMIGSIGVLLELVNLEKLYAWAHVERYAITTGPFKDAGAEYKPLTTEQRAVFQNMLNQVLGQFKKAIVDGRKLKQADVDAYADGRVWTGEDAVSKGLADKLGDWEDAKRALGEAVGLGKDPEVFKPRKHKGLYAMLEDSDGPVDSLVKIFFKQTIHPELRGQPLFLLPGAVGF